VKPSRGAAWCGNLLWLTSMIGCGGGTVVQDSFFATWELRSSTVGPLDCASASATEVDMDLVNLDTQARFISRFRCDAYQGTSGPVDVGNFDVLLNLTDPSGGVLSQAHIGTENVSTAGTIDLGHVIFTLP
jgi:hypothetical protein